MRNYTGSFTQELYSNGEIIPGYSGRHSEAFSEMVEAETEEEARSEFEKWLANTEGDLFLKFGDPTINDGILTYTQPDGSTAARVYVSDVREWTEH